LFGILVVELCRLLALESLRNILSAVLFNLEVSSGYSVKCEQIKSKESEVIKTRLGKLNAVKTEQQRRMDPYLISLMLAIWEIFDLPFLSYFSVRNFQNFC